MTVHDKTGDSLEHSTNHTSATLLHALQAADGDEDAWSRFVLRYEPLIQRWCHSWGLQDSDIRDVTQDVLLRLSRAMQKFEYDASRSFRAWLKTVTHHAWVDWARQQQKPGQGHGDTKTLMALQSVEAGSDFSLRLEAEYDAELMELAILRVRMKVKPRTWQAFQLTAMESRTGAEVAAELDMKVAHVYVAKSEVLKALRDEVMKLDPT